MSKIGQRTRGAGGSREANLVRRRGLAAALAIVVGLWVGACSSGSDSSPTEVGGLQPADVEFESLDLVNEARAAEGVEPQLARHATLSQIARAHSRGMRDDGFFGHVDSSGKGLRQRLDEAGVQYSRAAENLIQVHHATRPARVAHQQLMASPSHRENILSPKYRLAGVGVAKAGDTYWITQIFIRP